MKGEASQPGDTSQRPNGSQVIPPARALALRLGLPLGMALFAGLVLWLQSGLFDPSRLHVHSAFVDQGGYITTARHLLDTGEIESWLVYPAHVGKEAWRQYMPGHYICLALAYKTLGFSAFSSQLPNLIGFVLTCLGGFWIANHCYGKRAAWVTALLLAAFPASLNYAFTAMSELTFTAAGAVAIVGFLLAPQRLRPWLTPLLLALPFLFRETGALFVIPLGLVIAVLTPTSRPLESSRGPPEFPGLIAASVWITS